MISIIIPNYNNLPHLGRCIGSVKRQSFRKWECIIIDDGSTDGSVDEIKKHIQGDERFRLISLEKNAGLSNARNLGMRLAKGEYLCFLDSDDWLPNDSLDCLYGVASVHPDVGRVMGHDLMVWEDGHSLPHIITPGMHLEDSFTKDVDLGHSTGCLYIKKNLPDIKFPNVKIFEDMIFNMGLMFSGRRTFVLNKIVYNYYRHEGTLVSSKLTETQADRMRKSLKDFAAKYNPTQELYDRCMMFLDNAIGGRVTTQQNDK